MRSPDEPECLVNLAGLCSTGMDGRQRAVLPINSKNTKTSQYLMLAVRKSASTAGVLTRWDASALARGPSVARKVSKSSGAPKNYNVRHSEIRISNPAYGIMVWQNAIYLGSIGQQLCRELLKAETHGYRPLKNLVRPIRSQNLCEACISSSILRTDTRWVERWVAFRRWETTLEHVGN